MYVTKEIQNKFHKQKNYLHQRSIFREMMSTCDKLGNSFLTKEQTKTFQFMETKQKQDAKLSNIHKQRPRQRWSHQPNNHYCRKDDGQVFVKQSKQIKQIKDLRAKMLPKVSKTNFQKKLKQIIYIKNMGQKKRKNSNITSFIKKTEEKDEENILKQAWDSLQKTRIDSTTISDYRKSRYFFGKSKFSSSYLSQKSTPFLLSNQSSSLDVKDFIQGFQRTTKHNLTIADNLKINESDQIQIDISSRSRTNKINTSINSKQQLKLKLNCSRSNFPKKYLSQKVSFYRPPLKILDELGIQKNVIKEQNAHDLYNLIKGGYCLDAVEVQGQYISLKGFKQAKQNFKMLKQCYKAAKEHRYLSKNLQNELKGQSFKTLVYLSQLSGKIAPSQLNNLMKHNKVVQ